NIKLWNLIEVKGHPASLGRDRDELMRQRNRRWRWKPNASGHGTHKVCEYGSVACALEGHGNRRRCTDSRHRVASLKRDAIGGHGSRLLPKRSLGRTLASPAWG